ncbi:hypothetical protein AMTR_s00089p00170350 [Amborella trichopoda]|uniref:Uncharacterized protein n=1 Tax=Amborella trichopoda TaxID=13333 RepID=W1P1W3_AMBTC|nr:hypothetical protein AMTR_s00089p00170350 [Amborella trichopoda]
MQQDASRPTGRPYCTHYRKHGHTQETCYDLHSYPEGIPKRTPNGHFNRKKEGKRANNVNSNANSAASLSLDASEQGGLPSLPPPHYKSVLAASFLIKHRFSTFKCQLCRYENMFFNFSTIQNFMGDRFESFPPFYALSITRHETNHQES